MLEEKSFAVRVFPTQHRVNKGVQTLPMTAAMIEANEAENAEIARGLKQQDPELLDRLIADIGCTPRALAAALLRKATNGQALTLGAIEKERPLVPNSAPRERSSSSDRPERSGADRERRAPVPLAEGRARCRTALGARDGIAAKNLLGAILNEGGLAREAIGRIQVRDSFSLVELPEDGLERLLTKLKDTRVAGKQLKLRRYRED